MGLPPSGVLPHAPPVIALGRLTHGDLTQGTHGESRLRWQRAGSPLLDIGTGRRSALGVQKLRLTSTRHNVKFALNDKRL